LIMKLSFRIVSGPSKVHLFSLIVKVKVGIPVLVGVVHPT
jgi:hypothetical protein